MASDDGPIRIVASPDGRFKLAKSAESSTGSAAATATFIRERTSFLAAEIQHARGVVVRTWSICGSRPEPAEIMGQFPEIRELCVEADIYKYVADQGTRTPLSAALEIMHSLFPTYSSQSIGPAFRATLC
jgi:hypothetical protein